MTTSRWKYQSRSISLFQAYDFKKVRKIRKINIINQATKYLTNMRIITIIKIEIVIISS